MTKIPDLPFKTVDFSPKGGGLDFLGTRLVNLSILAEKLLPGINNVTRDFGTYCLGTWIPWKFREICQSQKDFSPSNYRRFREAIEVMMSHAIRDGSPSTLRFGKIRNRVGIEQKWTLPSNPTFEIAGRTNSNSIYAAPLYGPSLQYLKLLRGFAAADDRTSTGIPLANDDRLGLLVVKMVDDCLRGSLYYQTIAELISQPVSEPIVDDLGIHGLNPAALKKAGNELKLPFLQKLLPKEDRTARGRTLTAQLIGQTLKICGPLSGRQLRAVWHTGLTPSGERIVLDEEVCHQQEFWSIFQGRQLQRTFLELLLRVFELGLREGCRSMESVTDYAIREWEKSGEQLPADIDRLIRIEAKSLGDWVDDGVASSSWNDTVYPNHTSYEDIPPDRWATPIVRAVKMAARWFLRTYSWLNRYAHHKSLLNMGGAERLSMSYCLDWIDSRRHEPLRQFLMDLFADFIFVQHMRVALNRFDGRSQRLRFVLGDGGIVPTMSVGENLGREFVVMADRLDSLLALLVDLDVLTEDGDQKFHLGANAVHI